MSDDVTVTEQQEDIEELAADSNDEAGFSDAFKEATVEEKEETDDDEKPAETGKEESDTDEKPADDSKKEEVIPDEDKVSDDRGKEILADAEQKESKDKEDLSKKEIAETDTDEPSPKVLTKEQVQNFIGMIPKSELPDILEVDGREYNVKDYMEDFPEMQVISGMVTQKILERLVDNGVLITAEQYNEKIASIEDRMYGLHFDFTVLREVNDALEIVETKEYKTWVEKTATKEDLALLGSNIPKDYIMGLKKFLKASPASASTESKKEASSKAKAQKTDHNDLHSSTMRAKPGKDSLTLNMQKGSDEYSSAFKEAETKAEKAKKAGR